MRAAARRGYLAKLREQLYQKDPEGHWHARKRDASLCPNGTTSEVYFIGARLA